MSRLSPLCAIPLPGGAALAALVCLHTTPARHLVQAILGISFGQG